MKYWIIISCIAFITVVSGSFFLKESSLRDDDQLIVGTAAGYAPFVSINPQGDYEGFDVDIAQVLAKQMGKKLIIKDLGSMTSLFTALDQGSIDVIIWGLSITKERLQKVVMVHYQGKASTDYPLMFWKQIPDGVRTIFDMKGKVVCVEPSSSQEVVLRKYNFINPLFIEKVDDALLNMQYGKVDAAFVEPAIAKKFKNKFPEIQVLEVPLDHEDQVQGVGIVIKLNDELLIDQVQEAIATLKSTGIIEQFEQKWDIAS